MYISALDGAKINDHYYFLDFRPNQGYLSQKDVIPKDLYIQACSMSIARTLTLNIQFIPHSSATLLFSLFLFLSSTDLTIKASMYM